MSIVAIKKTTAAVITVPFVLMYVSIYLGLFDGVRYTAQLTLVFALVAQFLFLDKIQPGYKAQLAFGNKALGILWEDGYCYVPRLFPFLRKIDLDLLWSLKKPYDHTLYMRTQGEHHLYADQREPQYRVNSNASLLQAAIMRLTGNAIGWFTGVHRGDPDLLYHRVGERVMVLAVILATGSLVVHGKDPAWSLASKVKEAVTLPNLPSWTRQQEQPQVAVPTTVVTAAPPQRLEVVPSWQPAPELLPVELYSSTATIWQFTHIDGRKYVLYPNGQEKIPGYAVHEPVCITVPKGKMIAFQSDRPPHYVHNMEGEVAFIKNPAHVNWLRLTYNKHWLDRGNRVVELKKWEKLSDSWGEVQMADGVLAEAKPPHELPSDSPGGLVCF